ncbi:MAG: rRNA pseudouridine synthase [Betaproteobacteria bacterium]|nr:rRNA pseudouridine synthase [Betaproteobacteria bacterium]
MSHKMAKNSSVEESSNKKERIQKFLANMGIGSRRSIEELIRQKKITVNRKPIDLGHMVLGNEIIHIDGRRIYFKNIEKRESRLIIYHKPEGEIVSHSDPKHQKTVFQKLPKVKNGKWISIGRLDINTSGLLLITNDGKLANHMMHPSQQIDREYSVRILGEVTEDIINNIRKGVKLDDGF